MSKAWEIEQFLTVGDGNLLIDGVSAVALAREYGTPLFVFSEARIKHNIARLKRAAEVVDCRLKVCYAAKANSLMAILRVVREAGGELEVNSGGELWKALKAGFTGDQLIFNGTSKEVWEIEAAIEAGVYAIQVDSLYELALIEATARRLNRRARVSLRLVPEIETGTHSGLQTALLTSKFGMMPDEALGAFHEYKDSEFLALDGVHLHIGSQNPEAEPYTDALRTLFENLEKIYRETGLRLSHLNLGGGFPVNYLRDNSHEIEFPQAQREMFAAGFEPSEAIRRAWEFVRETARRSNAENLLADLTLLIEPGRSVIADAGVCLTTVRNHKERPLMSGEWRGFGEEEKRRRGEEETEASAAGNPKSEIRNPKSQMASDVWLLTDAGFNILLSMETYKWYYHLISAERAGAEHHTPYKLAGPLCDGGDVYFDIEGEGRLPDYRLLPEGVAPGEVLALLNCGAYSIAQMFQYNGRFLPAVVLVRESGAVELIRRRDAFEDLINNDLW
ncbi:MAG: alanine racemase [Acidobacteria bacterium]|nr:alanine racemase [Acidobacteriota bacterium]